MRLVKKTEEHAEARRTAGSLPGTKEKFILHILGGKGVVPCMYASDAAKAEANSQCTADKAKKSGWTFDKTCPVWICHGDDMPFSKSQAEAFQSQALRAIMSTNSVFSLFEDPEMMTLLGMARSLAPDILPSGKVVGGRLLNEAASTVDEKL
ncbi:hypothetical protein B0H10DRAFT_2225457 [Mycena sp. CBHHK59/15]|nr:hypothetical protein B0H10DRAFT_2225457 [Mycena sp. CBHHK59/15]